MTRADGRRAVAWALRAGVAGVTVRMSVARRQAPRYHLVDIRGKVAGVSGTILWISVARQQASQ
eukprot:2334399-Prorocentrum_lima.AAC.1